jgi:hypothetical protein
MPKKPRRDDRTGELPHTDLPPRRIPYYDDGEPITGPERRSSGGEPTPEKDTPGQPSGGRPSDDEEPG